MKKRIIKVLVVICLLCAVALTITACKGVKMTISFVVDGKTYSTIDTSGNEMITIPQSPTKDGYTFDGWYWDNGTWQRPFTASSLLNEPLTADMSVYAKFVIDEQYNNLQGTEIKTDTFTVNGANLSYAVANSVTTFSFINAIQVANGATFTVSYDINGNNKIPTKTVSLNIGDNTYYVLVENGNDIKLYTATIRRRPIYTITFVTNGGTACDSQQVEEDSLATEPTTSKTGYTFASWDYDFEQPITADTTITANWTANEYTITHDVNGGELIDTEYTATYNSAYTLAIPTREGYVFNGWYVDNIQITDADGVGLAKWTFLENKLVTAKWLPLYNITYVLDGGINSELNPSSFTANTEFYLHSPVKQGYEFRGWYLDDSFNNKINNISNGIQCNITLYALWVDDSLAERVITVLNPSGYYRYIGAPIFISIVQYNGSPLPQDIRYDVCDTSGKLISIVDEGIYECVIKFDVDENKYEKISDIYATIIVEVLRAEIDMDLLIMPPSIIRYTGKPLTMQDYELQNISIICRGHNRTIECECVATTYIINGKPASDCKICNVGCYDITVQLQCIEKGSELMFTMDFRYSIEIAY